MGEMSGRSVVVTRFHQRHAQQIGKKVPAFDLSNSDQDLEHLLKLVTFKRSAPAAFRDEILTGHRGWLFLRSTSPIVSQTARAILAITATMTLMTPIDTLDNASSVFHNLLGIGDDLGVIKREVELPPVLDPLCGRGVGSGLRVGRIRQMRQVGDADRVSARIAPRV
jgi:hypothetical protein